MRVKIVCRQVNKLQLELNEFGKNNFGNSFTSPKYRISGAAVFQIKVNVTNAQSSWNSIFIKFFKLLQQDNLTYTIKLTSNVLEIKNENFISDEYDGGKWHLLYERWDGVLNHAIGNFDLTVHMDTVPSTSPFAMLHEDTELADFELRGEDGSVRMHRAVLAAASPVLRRMLSGTWREAAEGRVDVPGTSKVILQNFKDYLYLHTLPDNGLEPLLLLASCYMMKDLEENCIYKIVSSLTAENACDWLVFAAKHNVTRLMLAILECVQNESLKVDELREHLEGSQ